jgi:hypothetical protein
VSTKLAAEPGAVAAPNTSASQLALLVQVSTSATQPPGLVRPKSKAAGAQVMASRMPSPASCTVAAQPPSHSSSTSPALRAPAALGRKPKVKVMLSAGFSVTPLGPMGMEAVTE